MTGVIAGEMATRLDACTAEKDAQVEALSTQIALLSAQRDQVRRDADQFRHLRSQLDLIMAGLDGLPQADRTPGQSESMWTQVMNLFQQDRARGWTSRQVVDLMKPAKPANVRSILSRATKRGSLVRDGDLYRLPGLSVVVEPTVGEGQATV